MRKKHFDEIRFWVFYSAYEESPKCMLERYFDIDGFDLTVIKPVKNFLQNSKMQSFFR